MKETKIKIFIYGNDYEDSYVEEKFNDFKNNIKYRLFSHTIENSNFLTIDISNNEPYNKVAGIQKKYVGKAFGFVSFVSFKIFSGLSYLRSSWAIKKQIEILIDLNKFSLRRNIHNYFFVKLNKMYEVQDLQKRLKEYNDIIDYIHISKGLKNEPDPPTIEILKVIENPY